RDLPARGSPSHSRRLKSYQLKEATELAATAIPGARVRVLDGDVHLAIRTDPAMVAAIRQFVLAWPLSG
ncbi:MAG TPA: hypothetical protein VK942_01070, partial [Actinomycetes bacterium]|nr:hypothetical protein [Actinomycetes bacterium]